MLKACWHFSFTVSDLERSIAFYCNLLGMRLMHRQEQANEYTARLVGYKDASLKIAQLTIDGLPATRSGHLLELVEYVHPDCEPTDTAICRPGTAHMAFEVKATSTASTTGWLPAAFASSHRPTPSPAESTRVAIPAIFSTPTTSRWRWSRCPCAVAELARKRRPQTVGACMPHRGLEPLFWP